LVVSYIFLPVGEVGAKRIGKFCRYLPEMGIRPVVLTAQERFYKFQDTSVLPPEGIQLARTTVWLAPLDLYARLRRRKTTRSDKARSDGGQSATEAQVVRPPGLLKRHLLALLQLPDPQAGWYFPAVREGSRLIEQERVAAILSTGPPWISHLVARRLKKKYRLPWLADFRDPWGYDPFTGNFIGWQQRLKQRMEANCVRWADRVLCNTHRLRQFFLSAYPDLPQEKFFVLPNGFDDAAPQPSQHPVPARSRRLFLHTGSLYAQRRVDTFCQALQMLVESGRLKAGSFQVVFLGDRHPPLAEAARASAPALFADGSIEFRPRIGWSEAQQLVRQADFLLLFQGHLRLEVPAKFFEYLPTGKPMLASVKEGALTDVIRDTGCGVTADPDDPADIVRQIERLLDWPAMSPDEARQKWAAQYHYRNLTQRLAETIRTVVPTPSASPHAEERA
jgi:glycosyltransferase involved in cell wall biosynthesis